MKIRNGFVSNSSSSSFVGVGLVAPMEVIYEIACNVTGLSKEDFDKKYDGDLWTAFQEDPATVDLGLSFQYIYDKEYFLGVEMVYVGDWGGFEQTFSLGFQELKERSEALAQLLSIPVDRVGLHACNGEA